MDKRMNLNWLKAAYIYCQIYKYKDEIVLSKW